jgi:hypothetical protein
VDIWDIFMTSWHILCSFGALFSGFGITHQEKSGNPRRAPAPGVDDMITIFCDFRQFSAKKLAFFSKINVMIQILHNLPLFWVKSANFFSELFGENILKILTSVPESESEKSRILPVPCSMIGPPLALGHVPPLFKLSLFRFFLPEKQGKAGLPDERSSTIEF